MANVKRSVLGCIAEMVLHVEPGAKGFEVFGVDKVGRKVVLSRRSDWEACVADAVGTAQLLSNFRKKPVRLEVHSGETQEFFPESE